MARKQGTVRIGPVTVFSLVVVLCLAVLSVLAVATAQASRAESGTQASFVAATYENEQAAQELLAQVDAVLGQARDAGQSREQAMTALKSAVGKELPIDVRVSGSELSAHFVADNGRQLEVTLKVTAECKYQIVQWKASTQWRQEESPGLLLAK